MQDSSPIILAIETATAACSVALCVGGDAEQQVYREFEIGNNIHSQLLLSMVEKVLTASGVEVAELQAVAVGQGPGSFTGIRIGVGVAQGLAYGVGCPMVGISSLEALALQAEYDGTVIAGIDARMGEVYWCEYFKEGSKLSPSTDLAVSAPSAINSGAEQVLLVGNAWSEYYAELDSALILKAEISSRVVYPGADSLLTLAATKIAANQTILATDFVPLYVRNEVAKKSQKNPF